MLPIRSPLGAIGALLIAMEGIAGATLFALASDPLWLRVAIVTVMMLVLLIVSAVVLWIIIYFAIKNPGFLFNPAEVAQLSESAQHRFFPPMDSLIRVDPGSLTASEAPSLLIEPNTVSGAEPDIDEDKPFQKRP